MGLEEVSLSQLDVYSASGWLDRIERAGNRLPDPATLFLLGTLVLMLLSQLAVWLDWQVQRDSSMEVETIRAVSLLDSAGIWWLLSNLVQNFVNFPPLGLVLVGLLGIGVSERSGLLPVLLRRVLAMAPRALLVPATVLVGVLSSLTLDAGYVVLPPLAGALFLAAGRSPLAGIAAVTSGVTCGFSANLFITGLDPLLAGLSTSAAVLLDPDYRVAITANWWFMIASTLLLTLLGTLVTTHIVEPRLGHQGVAEVAPEQTAQRASEDRGLRRAALMFLILSCLLLAAVLLPGAPLAGQGAHFPRWMEVLVPLLLILFLGIGLAYGIGAGTIRSDRDAVEMMSETMKNHGTVHRARLLRRPVHCLLRPFRARRNARDRRRRLVGADAAAKHDLGACLHRVGDGRQSDHGIGFRQICLLRSRVRAHVHAGRHQSGADPGRLSCRRFGN